MNCARGIERYLATVFAFISIVNRNKSRDFIMNKLKVSFK